MGDQDRTQITSIVRKSVMIHFYSGRLLPTTSVSILKVFEPPYNFGGHQFNNFSSCLLGGLKRQIVYFYIFTISNSYFLTGK